MGKNAVDRTVGSAQRENVCACLSSLELPAMINLVQAHALTLYVQAKACVMAKLENAFVTTRINTLVLAASMKNVRTTVLGMELVTLAQESATAMHATIAHRPGLAKIAAHQHARTPAITMVSAFLAHVTVTKGSPVRVAM